MTWAEFAAVALVVVFTCFLWVRGEPLEKSVLTAILTVTAGKVVLRPPHAVMEGMRLLREIARQVR